MDIDEWRSRGSSQTAWVGARFLRQEPRTTVFRVQPLGKQLFTFAVSSSLQSALFAHIYHVEMLQNLSNLVTSTTIGVRS